MFGAERAHEYTLLGESIATYSRGGVCVYIYMHTYIYRYIYIYTHPPTRRGNALLAAQISTEPQIQRSRKTKIQKSKNPKTKQIQTCKNPNLFARFRRCEKFRIFGSLDFSIFGFLYSGSLDLWISGHHAGTVFPCPVGARVG